ncbi:phage tail tip protein J-related protein [Vibrio mediterranei]
MATGLLILSLASAAYGVYAAVEAKRMADEATESAKGKRKAQKQMYKSATAPKQILMGHPITSGPMVFGAEIGNPNEEGKGEWIHIIVHLAGHPCHDVTDGWLDDTKLSRFDAGADVDYDVEFRHPNGEGFIYIYLGNHTAAPSTLASLPDWDDDMKGLGQCFAHMKLRSNRDKWAGGIPNPKFAVKGLEVYDPRTKTTAWTNNPALLIRWYRNVLKQGVADDDGYITAANLCNEHVSTPGGIGEKRYRCNYAFLANESPRNVLATLRSTCAGTSLRVAGRHSLQVGAYYGPGTVVLDEDDIVSDISTEADVRRRDRINTVTAKYTDPEFTWNEMDMPQIQNPTFLKEDGDFVNADDLDLTAVPSPYQAQRLSWINLNTKREAIHIELTCNLKATQLLPGKVFRLNFPENEWHGVEFIVTKWKYANDKGVTLSASQHTAQQYAWDGSQAVAPVRPGLPSRIDPTHVETVTHLQYTTLADSNTLQAVITWQHRSFGGITYELSFYQGGKFLRQETTTDKQFRLQDGFSTGSYEVRVRAIAPRGASPVASLAFSARAPQTPLDIDVTAGNWDLTLQPVAAGLINFDTMYDFAYGFASGASDADIEAHIAGRAKVLTISNLRANTEYQVAVREVSRWGTSPWLTKTAKTAFSSQDILELIHGKVTANMLDDSLKGALSQQEKRAIDLGNMLADKSRLTEGLRAAYQDFIDQGTEAKTQVGFAYAERTIEKHTSSLGVMAEEIAKLFVADKENLALAEAYTRAAVGYCVDKDGNITTENDAVACVAAGHQWRDGPLSEFIRNLQIQTASGAKASIGTLMQVFEKEGDKLVARGSLTSNVNGQITGLVSNNDGKKTQLDLIAQHTRIGVLDKDNHFQPLFYLNTQDNTLSIKAQLILKDGHTVNDLNDIRAQDGNDGDTIYSEFQFSSDKTHWHFPEQTGDRYMRSRKVTNGHAAAWGQITDLKGAPGNDATERYTWIKWSNNADGSSPSDDPTNKRYLGVAYNKTTPTESNNPHDYQWFLAKGNDGNDGTPGSGLYTLTLRNGAFPSSSTATGDFTQHIGRAPVRDDVLTYRNSAGTVSSSKSFDGANWIAPQLLLNGNLITPNSIYGDRFVANSEITSPIIKGGQGYFGAGGPYHNYHTHIDATGKISTNRLYMKSSETGERVELEPTRYSLYDNTNTLRIRMGRLK